LETTGPRLTNQYIAVWKFDNPTTLTGLVEGETEEEARTKILTFYEGAPNLEILEIRLANMEELGFLGETAN